MKNKYLYGSGLKLIAIIAMFVDHFGQAFLKNGVAMHALYGDLSNEHFDLLFNMIEWCHAIGRVAFPIFCFLLVEGVVHTHDVKKYMRNLLVFAVCSEPIYDYAFYGTWCTFQQQNVLFELAMALLLLIVIQKAEKRKPLVRWSVMLGAILALCFAAEVLALDGGNYGILLVTVFYLLRKKEVWRFCAFVAVVVFNGCYLVGGGFCFSFSLIVNWYFAFAMISFCFIVSD
jgi:TraX protein